MMRGIHWPSLVLLALSGCGGCGDDTTVEPDADIDVDATLDTDAPTTAATPIAGVYRTPPTVTLTADEPATIYYTTDGSTPTTSSPSGSSPVSFAGGAEVRFFAVDAAGNEESPQTIAYTIARFGPAPVEGFTATVDGADIDLAWTNPTDASFDEVVIARVADVSNADPADDVIYTGSAESFTDTAPGAGHHTYVAWARHDTGEVGEARTAGARIDEALQTFQITINVTAGTATVSTQPSRWTLAIANYADNAGNLTFDLTATSGLAGVTFVAKAVITAVSGGATFDSQDGTFDFGAGTKEYQRLGAEGIAMGDARTIPVEITANAATSITLDGTIVQDEAVFYSDMFDPDNTGIVDLRTGNRLGALPLSTRFSAGFVGANQASWATLVPSPDGRYVYAASRAGKLVLKIDTTTFAAVSGLFITTATSSAAARTMALDPSGKRLYVGLTDGGHSGANVAFYALPHNATLAASDAIVLEVDAPTMTETSRTTLASGDGLTKLPRLALSPDGRHLAAVTGTARATPSNVALHVVDLSDWSDQTVALGLVRGPNVAFDATGRYVFVGQANGAPSADALKYGIVDLTTMTMATYTGAEHFLGASRVGDTWIAEAASPTSPDHLQTIDPATGVAADLAGDSTTSGSIQAIARGRSGRLYVVTNTGTYVHDADGELLSSYTFPQRHHWISITP